MTNGLMPLRGMKDLLPSQWRTAQYIEKTAQDIAKLYGYEGFSTPILESADVFNRTLGDSSDVVSKEMYCFADRKGRIIALRPEFTAGIMRAVLSNNLKHQLPLRLFSHGPVFRYDRPQEGRQRQFHQVNFEHIGANSAYSDAETIALAANFLDELGILQNVQLELNSLGCAASRAAYQEALIAYFEGHVDNLSPDSKIRLTQNPLRILDSKERCDREITKNAPLITNFYLEPAKLYFAEVLDHLNALQVNYVLNPRLARGLDYYSHTTFEFTTARLGAQGTVLAGGRYDGLATLMGAQNEIPAIGFAAGIERLAMMCQNLCARSRGTHIIPIGKEYMNHAIKIAQVLRQAKQIAIIEQEGKVGKRLQEAVSCNGKYVIFIGDAEIQTDTYKLKDLDTQAEQILGIDEMLKIISS